ncbi:MAG: endonuclease MutS2 [Bacteroidia bacterium]
MPYPNNLEQKLEFTHIKELLVQHCLSPLGQQYVNKIRFAGKFDMVEKMLAQTNEFKQILTADTSFPADNYHDIGNALHKAKIDGIWLLEEELHKVRQVLQTFLQIARYFKERQEKYLNLQNLLEGLVYNDLVIRRIDRILDSEGHLKPNASPELAKISAKIHEKEAEIRKRINRIFEKTQNLGYLTDNIGITIREGRLVLPVLAEHKRHVPGFMHDESQTGQTVFIEPAECFDLNNILRELQIAYRRERERILLEVTDTIRPEIPTIESNIQRLGLFDFIRAKALLAIKMQANMPAISKHPHIELFKAYHPLLKLNHDKQKAETVPLNININRDNHIVVISGPNAGGKSVCLKTIGLLQYMLQCGLLIPADSNSTVGVFKDIMVDIGDEQSIESDLSTYSSHLMHMKHFTEFATGSTLFLIDEFGTGTDPQFGGPLAEAILNKLVQKKAFGVVTTHFSNLKNYAANTKGLINACMLFDNDKMQPLYVLELGKPGSSYAFELAQKSGLSIDILNYAKARVGGKQKKVDELLIELEKEKKHFDEIKKRYEEKEARANVLMQQYEKLKNEIEENKKQLIKKAKTEALAIVSEANSKVEAVIREIKEKKADVESSKQARNFIKSQIEQLKPDVIEIADVPHKKAIAEPLKTGSFVKVSGQDGVGEIVEIAKNKAVVAFGNLRTTIEIKRLETVEKPAEKPTIKSAPKGIDLNDKLKNFSTELNLIGTRGDDAVKILDDYLDDAHLLGIKELRIVHGKGFGILRNLIREKLKKSSFVERFADEHVEFGGDGVTIVQLKY